MLVRRDPPKGDGVRVRVASAGICGSDLHMIDLGFPFAGTLGHEFAGVLPDGRAAAIEPLAPCGECEPCRADDYNWCRLGPGMILGVGRDGGMAEEVRVPDRSVVPLPGGLAARDACLVEPLAVAVHGLARAGLPQARRVAVVGAGAVGLCAVAVALASGAEVGVVARHDTQREAAARLGAREVDGHYDLVVDAAGSADALVQAVDLCRPGATLALIASYWSGLELPGFALCLKEVRVLPGSLYSHSVVGRDFEVASALLAACPAIAEVLITHRFPLDAVEEAFAVARDRSAGAIKVVLEP